MQRGLTAGLLLILAVTSLLGFWTTRRALQGLREAESELAAAHAALQQLRDDNAKAFAHIQKAAESLLQQAESLQEPLSPAMVEQLQRGQAFLRRYIAQHADDPRAVPMCAKANYLVARIALQFGRLGEAEAAYRQSKRLLDELVVASPTTESMLGSLVTDNALACVLVSLGRFDDAAQLFRRLVERQPTEGVTSPLSDIQQATIALASRNLAVVTAAQGGDGTLLAQRSVTIAAEQVDRISDSLAPEEFLADSLQILAELQWRAGHATAAAATSRRSLAILEELLAKVPKISSRLGRTPPSIHYVEAAAMVRENLERLATDPSSVLRDQPDNGADPSTRDSRGGWRWRPLQPMPAETVPTDILVTGQLPAEFDRQEALLLAWLDRPWSAHVLTQIVAATWQRTQVIVLVESDLLERQAKQFFQQAGIDIRKLQFYRLPMDTIWARDWGPISISTGPNTTHWVDAASTANLEFPRFRDDHVPLSLSNIFNVSCVRLPVFLHGGAILGNGSDLCLVSKSQLYWNEQLGIGEPLVTRTLRRLTGADQLLYLEPLAGEPTEHLDWFLTFTQPETVVVGDYRRHDVENAKLLDQHAELLKQVTTTRGPLHVKRIPMPPRGKEYFGGTYTNVVFANGVLLVPTWPDASAENEEALAIYRELLPDWTVIGIDCEQLVTREGALHCAVRNIHRLPGLTGAPQTP